jgi:hypothetical protein
VDVTAILTDRSRDAIAIAGIVLAIVQSVMAIVALRRTRQESHVIPGHTCHWRPVMVALWASAKTRWIVFVPLGAVLAGTVVTEVWLRDRDLTIPFFAILLRNIILLLVAFLVGDWVSAHYPRLLRRYIVVISVGPALILFALVALLFAPSRLPSWAPRLITFELVCLGVNLFLLLGGSISERFGLE